VPDLDKRVGKGKIVLHDGTVVGEHEGYPFYTIGQRRGLNLALGYPVYVTHIDPSTNTIVVGPKEALLKQALIARNINFVKYPDLLEPREAVGKIRYKDEGLTCRVQQVEEDALQISFAAPRRAITPGQSVVLYEGNDVLAGGWIHSVLETDDAMVSITENKR